MQNLFICECSSPPPPFKQQIVVYLTDEHRAVGTFPRFYVHFHSAIFVRAKMRRITMLPGNEQCQSDPESQARAIFLEIYLFKFILLILNADIFQGRSSCWLRRWLREKVLEPFNCTVFYLGRNKYREFPVCQPITIVRNYLSVIDLRQNLDGMKRRVVFEES